MIELHSQLRNYFNRYQLCFDLKTNCKHPWCFVMVLDGPTCTDRALSFTELLWQRLNCNQRGLKKLIQQIPRDSTGSKSIFKKVLSRTFKSKICKFKIHNLHVIITSHTHKIASSQRVRGSTSPQESGIDVCSRMTGIWRCLECFQMEHSLIILFVFENWWDEWVSKFFNSKISSFRSDNDSNVTNWPRLSDDDSKIVETQSKTYSDRHSGWRGLINTPL